MTHKINSVAFLQIYSGIGYFTTISEVKMISSLYRDWFMLSLIMKSIILRFFSNSFTIPNRKYILPLSLEQNPESPELKA